MPLVVPVLPSISLSKQNILQCSILIFFLLSPYTKITLFTASTLLQISLSLPLSHVLSLCLSFYSLFLTLDLHFQSLFLEIQLLCQTQGMQIKIHLSFLNLHFSPVFKNGTNESIFNWKMSKKPRVQNNL